jgi:hypothetical protein
MPVSPEQVAKILRKIDFQPQDTFGRGVLLLGKRDAQHYDAQIDVGNPYFLEKFGLMLIHNYLLNQGIDKEDLDEITQVILNQYNIPAYQSKDKNQ